ncbi:MAG: antibiotic biosynthesis monooxygenase [Corynebacterium sp.]|nr:antibiotic biosynthesis monooxygenase [Corynebacterium sp.]
MSIVKINAITAGEGLAEELERRFEARKHAVDGHPGFEGFKLLRPTKGDDRYFVFTQWADEESYQAWRTSDAGSHAKGDPDERKKVAPKAQLLEFDVVFDIHP